ncbi:MAG: hypothetical protein ACRC2T_06320, partial [Thermoguttaceae bacterium]
MSILMQARLFIVILYILLCYLASNAAAQTPPEWSPYRIGVCTHVTDDVLVRLGFKKRGDFEKTLAAKLSELAETQVGTLWNLDFQTNRVPAWPLIEKQFADRFLKDGSISEPEISALLETELDKIVYVVLENNERNDLALSIYELDLKTLVIAGKESRILTDSVALCDSIVAMMIAVFSPTATIERSQGEKISLRIHGAALINRSELLHERINSSTIFIPFVRTFDASGKLNAVSVIPWTALIEPITSNTKPLQNQVSVDEVSGENTQSD